MRKSAGQTETIPANIQPESPLTIIAIGASAGGLEALQEFIAHLPELNNFCILIAQHLSPTHKSMLVELLSRETKRNVQEATHGAILESNKIYITPPDNEITIVDGFIHLQKPSSPLGPKPSVDILFQSLGQLTSTKIIAVILSGTGSDGAAGIKELKRQGAYVIAQDPESAKYDGMPSSAIQTGFVDAILRPEKMGEEIRDVMEGKQSENKISDQPDASLPTLQKILFYLGRRSGADFSNYKTATICRRLEKRMDILKVSSIEDYLKIIEENPREADEMFQMVLIGVTMFFRDVESFQILENYLRQLLAEKTNHDPIRIWVPGCSTGEEAYSIAILINRILKERTAHYNVQIFATDIDQEAISFSRKGQYDESAVAHLPTELIDQYFIRTGTKFELIKKIRSMVLFSRHDVIRNPPFLKMDLISCRNLLIYFNSALQQQVIPIFHYALNPEGILFLGKSETIGQFGDLFNTADNRHKIYIRKRGGSLHGIKFSAFKAQQIPSTKINYAPAPKRQDITVSELVKESLFNTFEHPYVVVNDLMDVQEVNGDVRLFMSLSPGGISLQLIKMLNPELQIEVRSILTKSIKERISVKSKIKKFELFGNRYFVRINAKPLLYKEGTQELFVVIFERLDLDELFPSTPDLSQIQVDNARVAELEHELAATKEHLQTYIEEIETSNEELQSLNEELQSTNEELQSSNEELETSNEELQSTNEEIQIAYAELKTAHDELEKKEKTLMIAQANTEALLANTLQSFMLVDNNYRIVKHNEKASYLFQQLRHKRLRNDDLIIDMIPAGHVEDFIIDFNTALQGHELKVERQYMNAMGGEQWFTMEFSPVTLENGRITGVSLAMLETTEIKRALHQAESKQVVWNDLFNRYPLACVLIDEHDMIVQANEAMASILDKSESDLTGKIIHLSFEITPHAFPADKFSKVVGFKPATCAIGHEPQIVCYAHCLVLAAGSKARKLICILP